MQVMSVGLLHGVEETHVGVVAFPDHFDLEEVHHSGRCASESAFWTGKVIQCPQHLPGCFEPELRVIGISYGCYCRKDVLVSEPQIVRIGGMTHESSVERLLRRLVGTGKRNNGSLASLTRVVHSFPLVSINVVEPQLHHLKSCPDLIF